MSTATIGKKCAGCFLKTISVLRNITEAIVRGFQRAKWVLKEFKRACKRKPRPVKSRKKRPAKQT